MTSSPETTGSLGIQKNFLANILRYGLSVFLEYFYIEFNSLFDIIERLLSGFTFRYAAR